MVDWVPRQYERFKNERSQPFFDLLALVRPQAAMRVVDLGCGTGELTAVLHERLQARTTLGVDSSDAMLAQASACATSTLGFEKAAIESFVPGGLLDLIFSNAALHWVDDHGSLLARLASALAPGGQIAVQIPSNDDHPSHLVAAEVAREKPFVDALGGYARVFPNLPLTSYATKLEGLGFCEQHVRLQVYGHRLAGRDDVVEWVRGTLLTDYERRMPQSLWPAFLDRYQQVLLPRLDDAHPFFFAFKRILFWGKKS